MYWIPASAGMIFANLSINQFTDSPIDQFTDKKNILVVGCKSFELDESNLYIYHYCACGNSSLSVIVISYLQDVLT